MHNFALNERFLRCIQKEIAYKVQELKDMEALSFIYYFLLPHCLKQSDQVGRRPLTMCLMQTSPKCMEVMLEMLMLDTQQDYMKYIEPRLFKFMGTKSIVFYNFLERSCRKF